MWRGCRLVARRDSRLVRLLVVTFVVRALVRISLLVVHTAALALLATQVFVVQNILSPSYLALACSKLDDEAGYVGRKELLRG